jgi:hypothetical protein
MSCVLLSLYVPMAVNCCVALNPMLGVAGVTAIDFNVAEVTFSGTRTLVIVPTLALICVVPATSPRANPPLAEMEAVAGVAEVQVAMLVMFAVLRSLYVPVAVNCCVVPNAIEGAAGVTLMVCNVALVMPSGTAVLLTVPNTAVIFAVPAACPRAIPEAALIAAIEALDVDQVTACVMSCVLPSLNVPVAANCSVAPFAMEELAGVTAMDASVAEVTVRLTAGLAMPWVELGAPPARRNGEPVAAANCVTEFGP